MLRPGRALVTQNHMVDFAGSEVVTLELAEALAALGAEVTVFCNTLGDPMAGAAATRGVRVVDDDTGLAEQDFDLVWIHHQVVPDAVIQKLASPDTTVVFEHLSPFEPLELPLLADVEQTLAAVVVGNSEETVAALRDFGLTDVPTVVLGNPAPEETGVSASPLGTAQLTPQCSRGHQCIWRTKYRMPCSCSGKRVSWSPTSAAAE